MHPGELGADLLTTAGRAAGGALRQREPVADAAQGALAGELTAVQRQTVEFTLERIEAALRARALASVSAPTQRSTGR